MKVLQYIFIIITVFSGIGAGAVRFGYISDDVLKGVIFTIFVISIIGDAVIAFWKLRRKKWGEFSQDKRNAEDLLKKALDMACLAMVQGSKHEFRACVFLKCPRDEKKICIAYHSSNMEGEPDLDIRFEKWQGCAGKTWGYGAPIVADLTLPELTGGIGWGITQEQMEKTKALGAILSVPIRHTEEENKKIGILSFDTKEPIADFLSREKSKDTAIKFASQIGLLLYAFGQIYPLE